MRILKWRPSMFFQVRGDSFPEIKQIPFSLLILLGWSSVLVFFLMVWSRYMDLVERIRKSDIWTILWEIINIELQPNNMNRKDSFHFCKK
jgi:hypothetical protein